MRTPVGAWWRHRTGSATSPAHGICAALDRDGIDGEDVDAVSGLLSQVGAQSSNIARTAALSAGLPESVPGFTLDRQCGSSQQAVHLAAQAVMSGAADLVLAGGVEVMSRVPIASPIYVGDDAGLGHPRQGERYQARYGDQEITQFRGAELIAEQWNLSRGEMEEFALESHRRASTASDTGLFDAEIAPIAGVERDEGPRPDTPLRRCNSVAILPGFRLTAALAAIFPTVGCHPGIRSAVRLRGRPRSPRSCDGRRRQRSLLMLIRTDPGPDRVLSASVYAGRIGVTSPGVRVRVLAWLAETVADAARTTRRRRDRARSPLGPPVALMTRCCTCSPDGTGTACR